MKQNEEGINDLIDDTIYENLVEETDNFTDTDPDDSHNTEGLDDLIGDEIYEIMVAEEKEEIFESSDDYQRILERER